MRPVDGMTGGQRVWFSVSQHLRRSPNFGDQSVFDKDRWLQNVKINKL